MAKQMEGNPEQRRRKAREAREQGEAPSAVAATQGASKQRKHVKNDEDHTKKLQTIREGKQPMLSENTPKPRQHSQGRGSHR
jgi:hypothetical protein